MPKAVQKTSVGRRIFISYCHADYPHALRLHRALTPMCERLGDMEIFFDYEALKAGNLWEAQIRTALEETDVFIVILRDAYKAWAKLIFPSIYPALKRRCRALT